MLRVFSSSFFAACLWNSTFAQTHRISDENSHIWVSHWGDQRFHDRWSFHTEGHWRRADLGARWQQLLLRPAINFHLNEQVLFTEGYSYYINYPYSTYSIGFQNWEHHLWQQIQLTQAISRVRVQHRFRLEERFIARLKADEDDPSHGVFDSYGYQNRFRYRVWVTIPLGAHEKVAPGVFTANLYDEVFLSFGDPARLDHINQNRISALLGYQVNEQMNVLGGYLYQTIQRPGAANGADLLELNSTIHLALVYSLDLRKKGPMKAS